MSLVTIEKNKPTTTSLIFAENSGIAHLHILQKIRKVSDEISLVRFNENFKLSSWKNERNREYPLYIMTEEGFSFLMMKFDTKSLNDLKWAYIDAFKNMREQIERQTNSEWIEGRNKGKQARKELATVINDFVEYATSQGSKNAKFYYSTITKEAYKALSLIEKNEKVCKDFRNTLTSMDLAFLQVAEYIAQNSIIEGMKIKLHYKDIYQAAKLKVLEYASTVTIRKIN